MVEIREPFAQALALAVTETFENMAFLEVLPGSAAAWDPLAEPPLGVCLPLLAPVQGVLRLRVPRSLLNTMAATLFLRREEEVDETLRRDLAAELINTLGGRFLSRLLSPEQPFQLGLPQPLLPPLTEGEQPGATWYFKAENLTFALEARGQALLGLLEQTPLAAE
mgnify:CR=1 FL=1